METFNQQVSSPATEIRGSNRAQPFRRILGLNTQKADKKNGWADAKISLPEWLLKIQRAILLFHGEQQ
ncbi:hypothetical protein ACIXBV_19400 [Bacteroides fragilis]